MMRFRVPALTIVLALAAYWLICTPEQEPKASEESTSSEGSESDPASPGPATIAGAADPLAVAPPVRMRSAGTNMQAHVAPIASIDSLADAYQSEDRDDRQAKIHDGLVRGIIEELAEAKVGTAHIDALDCRSQHCKLQLASEDQQGLVKLVDALQDERGFLGRAESMMLSRQDDTIVLYLRFPRPK